MLNPSWCLDEVGKHAVCERFRALFDQAFPFSKCTLRI